MPPARRSTRTVSSTVARESAQPYTRANTRTSPGSQRPSASVAANGKTSLRLTVKAPPSKLRQATSGSSIPPNPYADNPSESDTTPAPRVARSTRNPRTVVDPDSDEVDEDAEGEEEDEEEEADVDMDQELLDQEDSEEDAEGEDEDEDELQQDHPPPPVIKQNQPNGKAKPNVTVTAPPEGPLKSVEAKEMEDDDDDGELSELPDEDEEELSELSSDDDDENSRSATPDLTKLTKRQRGAYDEEAENTLMALSNEAQKKKHLTAEEHAMRRAEMARRRKNLSEKRNEEEKVCRLLLSRTSRTDSNHRWTRSTSCSRSQRRSVEREPRWKPRELPNSRLVLRTKKRSLILCICDG